MDLRSLVSAILQVAAWLSLVSGVMLFVYAFSEIDFWTALVLLLSGVVSWAFLIVVVAISEDLATLRAAVESGHRQGDAVIAEVRRTNSILSQAMQ